MCDSESKTIPRIGVGVMLLAPHGYVFMRRLGSHGSGTYSFPGGHLEYGESVIECAVRECQEELGVLLRDPATLSFFTEDFFPDYNRHYITLYVTGWCDTQPRICEPEKCDHIKFVTLGDKLPDLLFSGIRQAWDFKLNAIVHLRKNG